MRQKTNSEKINKKLQKQEANKHKSKHYHITIKFNTLPNITKQKRKGKRLGRKTDFDFDTVSLVSLEMLVHVHLKMFKRGQQLLANSSEACHHDFFCSLATCDLAFGLWQALTDAREDGLQKAHCFRSEAAKSGHAECFKVQPGIAAKAS